MTIFDKRGINPKMAEALKKEPELYAFSEKILEKADMNANSFKNFVRYTREVALREGESIEAIFEKAGLLKLLENEKLSEKTRAEELLAGLYNLRYPFWSQKQANFTKLKNKFRAVTGGEIAFPDFAEGNSFKVTFTIKDASDIDKIEETIAKAAPLMRESLAEIKENS